MPNKQVQGNPEVEACVACRFIWENIEEALGNNSRNSILAAQAFQYFCKIAPDIFFQPCNDMFELLYDMSEDFSKKVPTIQICLNQKLCKEGLL